jgi:hypothetical protein
MGFGGGFLYFIKILLYKYCESIMSLEYNLVGSDKHLELYYIILFCTFY